jgi:L-lactate dehydrogenase complex protein LldG
MKREQFLSNIRARLGQALLPEPGPEHPGPFRSGLPAAASQPELVRKFKQELEALSGHVYVAENQAEAVRPVLEICRRHEAARILAWDEAYLGLAGITAALNEAGISVEEDHVPPSGEARQARLEQLAGVTIGLTGAVGGLADTGAIALTNGAGRGRLASLLPPVHIALLPARKLYPSLPAFLAAHPGGTEAGSNLVFVAGPSRTGDIEMTLTMGVHGPGEVHVIITQ